MPTYQYVCTECNEPLEAVQSFTDDALTDCPVCTGRLRKVFSAVGVVFKGSGFYRNDSRAGNGDGAKTASTSSESKESSKDSASKDSASKDSSSKESSSKDSSSKDSSSSSSGTKSTTSASSAA